MARYYVHRYTVEGYGRFPIDMLRYDGSYPATEADSAAAENSREFRRVTLEHIGTRPWEPCKGRWNSFLWGITDQSPPAVYD